MTDPRRTSHQQIHEWMAPPDAFKRAFSDRVLAQLRFPCHRCTTEVRFDEVIVPLPTLVDRNEIFHTYCSNHCANAGCSTEYCEHPRVTEEANV